MFMYPITMFFCVNQQICYYIVNSFCLILLFAHCVNSFLEIKYGLINKKTKLSTEDHIHTDICNLTTLDVCQIIPFTGALCSFFYLCFAFLHLIVVFLQNTYMWVLFIENISSKNFPWKQIMILIISSQAPTKLSKLYSCYL